MTILEADFRIVTPLFMGGADPKEPALRAPGIKGALRFWWRAAALGRHNGNLEAIKEEEGKIFGSTKHGQSRVIMEVSQKDPDPVEDQFFKGCQGLIYLGYGPIEKGKLTRKYLKPPIKAKLHINILPRGNDELPDSKVADQLSSALMAMGLFGGLGSRSRRGFGSFNLLNLKSNGVSIFEQPASLDDLKKRITDLLSGIDRSRNLPNYTAFSSETSVYVYSNRSTDPLKTSDEIGKRMQQYRVGTRGHPCKFSSDTDLARKALSKRVDSHPDRVFFGLPHNYHFLELEATLEVKGRSNDTNYERRASPLFIHIQELKNGEYAAVVALIPAIFLPEGARIFMKRQKKEGESRQESPESEVQVDEDAAKSLKVIRDFLDSNFEKVFPE
ncbi:MAG: type III-B CRISPR module RAMP protein Cmr1 [Methanothrix sp.]|nr:type III-B CRISPR module RAMP protein Cmr1 [Methanothrix sp.]